MSTKIEIFTGPRCPYCEWAKRLLDKKNVTYEEILVDNDERRQEVLMRSKRASVPQIFIGETHVGGYDDLVKMDNNGELDTLLGQ